MTQPILVLFSAQRTARHAAGRANRCVRMNAATRLVRFAGPDGQAHTARVQDLPVEPLDSESLELPPPYTLLAPVDPPEVWCAGVTYLRSRDARVEGWEVEDVYSLVYEADRPELFLKDAGGRRTVGPGAPIGVRSDSTWDVPEPEIGLVLGEAGAITGVTIGNDVSSRSIEGANPLYIPQAKVFRRACALGPAVAGARRPFRGRSRSSCESSPPTVASSSQARPRRSRCTGRSTSWPAGSSARTRSRPGAFCSPAGSCRPATSPSSPATS